MKIKIAILINDFFFNNYETFYERLKNHSDIFECIVIATEGYSDKNKNSHAISEYLTSIEVENIDYKKGKKLFSLQEYKPDYVFYRMIVIFQKSINQVKYLSMPRYATFHMEHQWLKIQGCTNH